MYAEDGPTFRELIEQALSSTQRGYDLLAPKFDRTPFRTPDVVVERTLADLGPVERSVDLCCGTGVGLAGLATVTQEELVGVDFSEGMLEEARKRTALLSPTPKLLRADVFEWDGEGRFDLATCFGALGHVQDHEVGRFLGVVRRALKPGGRFVFVTAHEAPVLSRRYLIGRAFNGVMRVRNALVQPPFIMYYLTFELPRIERVLKFHGFDVAVDPPDADRFSKPFQELVRVVATKRGQV
jgi:ubiquinone/menaquinone biosynthesis C-methylase UbiE